MPGLSHYEGAVRPTNAVSTALPERQMSDVKTDGTIGDYMVAGLRGGSFGGIPFVIVCLLLLSNAL